MPQFERNYESIRGRTVAITSWLSLDTHTWQASAPAYSLSSVSPTANSFSSRNAAVASVANKVDQSLRRTGDVRPPRRY